MYTLENLKSSLEEIVRDPFDGFTMNTQLKDLASKLILIEKEFQSINKEYKIEFIPVSTGPSNEGYHLNMKLLYNNEEIFSQNTYYNFVLYGGSTEYENAQFSKTTRGVQKEISFKKKPHLYTQLVENDFIKVFLKNEKLLVQKIALNELNENLRKIDAPSLKNPYLKYL